MTAVSRIVLLGSRADTIPLSAVARDTNAHAIVAAVPATLQPGTYTVAWSTAAADGHGARGSFTFTIESDASVLSPKESTASTRASEKKPVRRINEAVQLALGAPMWMARWLGFIALFFLIGAVSFRFVILGRIPAPALEADEAFRQIATTGAATAGMIAAVVITVGSVLKLYGETVAMQNVPARTILFATSWGWAWLAEIAACVVAVVAFAIAHRTGTSRGTSLFAVPLDVLHVLAGSSWLGTLAVILFVGLGAAAKAPGSISTGPRLASLINAFSPLALMCGGAVVATGVATSLLHLEPISRLWTSTYGMTLIVKLALVSLLFSLGVWNWRRVKPNLGGEKGVLALRFSAKMELFASALVLAVTAFLVALPLPD